MSATDKDNKTKDDEISALLDDDIDHDHDNDTHLTVASSTDKRPGSPQLTKKDTTIKNEDEDEEDINIHSSVPAAAPATTATATPVAAPVAAPLSTTAAAPLAQTQAPPTTNPAASEREARLAILTEAFPTVEKEVCEFVLESHRGDVEASINALLEISDPEFHAEPAPQPAVVAPAPTPARVAPSSDVLPALPRRQTNELEGQMGNLNLGQNQTQHEIDPILLASTSTSEQQLRADEDFARTLAAMDEYRARDRQNVRGQHNQQQEQEGPGFVAEMKGLMDEELPKIKERFNVAADTTKKKVNEWYSQFKANRAEAAQRQAAANAAANDGSHSNANQGGFYNEYSDRSHEPIRYGSRLDEDEPLDLQFALNANPNPGLNQMNRR
ncbi:ubiquitin-binding protein cue5 [Mortierella sp. AD031]|nr:ubiquitin-binding protein cue5 [Mortierella sp. AD031]